MDTMNAITFQTGGPETLRLETVERPSPIPTEVLVRTSAIGVNPVDWKTRGGSGIPGMFDGNRRNVLGWDIAGTVEEVGPGVTLFKVGDRVFGMPRFPHPASAYAEFVTARARELAHVPGGMSDVEAGALPLAGLTAWQALVDTLDVGDGTRVLIHAAAGGVGHLAVQIAKARGAEVWATASKAKHELLRELGVDHPIDYRNDDFTQIAKDMDAVLDLVGGEEHVLRSLSSVKRGGQLLVIPSPADLPAADVLAAKDVTAQWMLVEPDRAGLEALASLYEAGSLRVLIAETRPFESLAELHQLGERGGTTGKLVATISSAN